MRDVILAQAAGTDSPTNASAAPATRWPPRPDFALLHKAFTKAQEKAIPVKVGNIFTGDLYYDPDDNLIPALEKFGVLGIDMEVAGLYGLAHQQGLRRSPS